MKPMRHREARRPAVQPMLFDFQSLAGWLHDRVPTPPRRWKNPSQLGSVAPPKRGRPRGWLGATSPSR